MATAEAPVDGFLARRETSDELARGWRKLTRVATFVAILTSPAAFGWFHHHQHMSLGWSIAATFLVIIAFRGLVDLIVRRFIPWPSLFGTDDAQLREEDVVNRRRAWFWHFWFKLAIYLAGLITIVFVVKYLHHPAGQTVTWQHTGYSIVHAIGKAIGSRGFWLQAIFVTFLFLANFLIFMGPLMLMGISQIKGFEPGDADWGVKLEDVRGQAEAKEEVRRIVSLWQSGEAFEKAGGKRERGILFLGAPGTGKTMLAKAIATGFNSPFVSIPGSGFAQTFIGIDALIVRFLARKAKKLAAKWGGQCIVFIDEIDAVGMRRQSLGAGGRKTVHETSLHDLCFYGPYGAITASGDVVIESREWRERLFNARAPEPRTPYPSWVQRATGIVNQAFPGGMFGGTGQLALNQLLVTMDGIDNPPFFRRFFTNRLNSLLDASYLVPRRLRKIPLRLPRARPSGNQIYFIGATNVPMEVLDPALTRPGRMGRHVWFRTPTKEDRKDVFDLYLGKVAHDPELDSPRARDELARITNGYSPAMIDQVCSMALTYAQHSGRERFARHDLVEAMTTVESGTAIGVESVPEELRATAIHEAGHAIASHVFQKNIESTRLSIKMRGGSLGHYYGTEKEERFSRWQSEMNARLVMVLAAMAAEHVFYRENTNGVGGDVQTATATAAMMVGTSAMGPQPIQLPEGQGTEDEREFIEQTILSRFEKIGLRIMNRASFSPEQDASARALTDPDKRRVAAQIIGQAYVIAYNAVRANKDAAERIAEVLVEKRELYGDEVIDLLEAQRLQKPELDYLDPETWPPTF